MRLDPDDPHYPSRLLCVPGVPVMTVSGHLDAPRTIGIVGSRRPRPFARTFARELAFELASAGVTIVSGGAQGIDGAAHEAALDAGGATWVVCPCGRSFVAPHQHARLFARVESSPMGRMIWPFEDDVAPGKIAPGKTTFTARNRVLVGLSDAVVLIQARDRSGSQNAARWARSFDRPLWVLPGPTEDPQFEGSRAAIKAGGHVLVEKNDLFRSLGVLPPGKKLSLPAECAAPKRRSRGPGEPAPAPDMSAWSRDEMAVFSATSEAVTHLEDLVASSRLTVSAAVTALLTLSLKNVVVEGPDGFFRRVSPR